MAGFYEGKRDGTVLNALKRRGFALTLHYPTNDTFDDATGAVTAGVPQKVSSYGLFIEKRLDRNNPADQSQDTLQQKRTRTIMIAASGVSTPPDTNTRVVIDCREFVIQGSKPLSPGNIDLYYEVDIVV
jgi:hypothetical protein